MTDRSHAVSCYKYHQHVSGNQVTSCISVHLYEQLKDGACVSEPGPVTNQPVPKGLLQKCSANSRKHLRLAQCERVFHQTCEGRQREASSARKLCNHSVLPSGETDCVLRDLRHHLCEHCLEIVQPGDLSTKYTEESIGYIKTCAICLVAAHIAWAIHRACSPG